MKIDAHHHLWDPSRGDYGWLTPELGVLYRTFGPEDVKPLLKAAGVDGTVLVQAAPTVAETDYMLAIARENDFIKGVVGWVDFEAPDAPEVIARLAREPLLKGLRPMIQDIADPDWMLKEELAPAFEALIGMRLRFDALTFPVHLENLRELIRRYPDLAVVIDHGSKPYIKRREIAGWEADMRRLARETDALCKVSGLVTEASEDWTPSDLRPYVDVLLDAFGPDRLMWGSDWPVSLLASDYAEWEAVAQSLLDVSDEDRAKIFGLNAVRFYGLE